MICSGLSLSGFLESVYLAQHFVGKGATDQLRSAVRRFERYCGGPIPIDELCDDAVSAWLHAIREDGLRPATVNTRRGQILSIWKYAWQKRYCHEPPRDVPSMREPRLLPDSWSVEEVGRLIHAASQRQGIVGQWPASDWWPALVYALWWTASRIGAMLHVALADYDCATGSLILRNTKTEAEELHRLHPVAMAAIAKVYSSDQRLLFVWPHYEHHLWWVFRKIVETSGLPARKCGRQLFHKLRRSALTELWKRSPELAQRLAGHRSQRMTWDHYIDPRRIGGVSTVDLLPVPQSEILSSP